MVQQGTISEIDVIQKLPQTNSCINIFNNALWISLHTTDEVAHFLSIEAGRWRSTSRDFTSLLIFVLASSSHTPNHKAATYDRQQNQDTQPERFSYETREHRMAWLISLHVVLLVIHVTYTSLLTHVGRMYRLLITTLPFNIQETLYGM